MVNNLPVDAGDARDMGSIPGLGRPPGEVNGNPLQYSCRENYMDRGGWQARVDGGHKKSQMQFRNKTTTISHSKK